MNNLLFIALIIALLYYFFYYLPTQKKLNAQPLPLKHHQSTQTEVITESNANVTKRNSPIRNSVVQDYQNKIKVKDTQIAKLQAQIRDLAKKPSTKSKFTQTDSEMDLTNTLDTLIKDIQELNNSLDEYA